MKALTIGGFAATALEGLAGPIYERYKAFNNRDTAAQQALNSQLNSTSMQTRYQATQSYNAAAGASTPQNQLWVTPNGAVVNWGGQVVARPQLKIQLPVVVGKIISKYRIDVWIGFS